MKRIVSILLATLMLALLVVPSTSAYVPTDNTATDEETVWAVVQKSNISEFAEATVDMTENGFYAIRSTNNYSRATFKVPPVDAGTYTNVLIEVKGIEKGVRPYIVVNYSDGTSATKGYTLPESSVSKWVTLTATFDAKTGVKISSVKFQPWGETNPQGETCLIRSIRLSKFAERKVLDYPLSDIWSRSGVTIGYNIEKDGYSCTTYEKNDQSTWRGMNLKNGYQIDTSVYRYAVIDCYYEYETGTQPTLYPTFTAIKVDDVSNGKNFYPAQERYNYRFAESGDTRQSLKVNEWNHFVFPLDSNYNGVSVGGIITFAGMQFCSQDGNKGADYKVYIRSIQFVSSLEDAEPITITPDQTQDVTLSTADANTALPMTTVFNDRIAWKVGTEEKKGGAVTFNGVKIPTARYNYVLVNCYYTGAAGGMYPTVRITGSEQGTFGSWYHLYTYKDTAYSKDNRGSVTNMGGSGKWLTLAFPIWETDPVAPANAFAPYSYITNFVLQLHGDGGTGDAVYVSSVTFSATPMPVEDATVNDEIVFAGTQGVDNPVVGQKQSIRFVATMSEIKENYRKVGFEVIAGTKKWDRSSNTVYTKILGTENGVTTEYTAAELGGAYIVALDLSDVPVGEKITFTVRPYVLDENGEKVYGVSAEVQYGADGKPVSVKYVR